MEVNDEKNLNYDKYWADLYELSSKKENYFSKDVDLFSRKNEKILKVNVNDYCRIKKPFNNEDNDLDEYINNNSNMNKNLNNIDYNKDNGNFTNQIENIDKFSIKEPIFDINDSKKYINLSSILKLK